MHVIQCPQCLRLWEVRENKENRKSLYSRMMLNEIHRIEFNNKFNNLFTQVVRTFINL